MTYTLQELFKLPNIQNKIIKIVEETKDEVYLRNLYIDYNGILRYDATDVEIRQYGDNIIAITKETINFHYKIVPNYISFEDAFSAWYYQDKTIVCELQNGSINTFYGTDKDYNFRPEQIISDKWYVRD